jgi:hypothetical protein
MSTISAGTATGTALVSTGDTTGQLVLQTNGTTTAVTIGTNQVVTLAQPLPAGSGGTGNAFFSVSGPASSTKTYTFPNENMTVGYRNLPAVGTQTGSYTLVAADVGKYVQIGSGGSITVPTSVFAEGDAITLYNNTTGNITITCSAPTAYVAGTNTVRTSLTLATRGVATILFYSATACVVSGNVT